MGAGGRGAETTVLQGGHIRLDKKEWAEAMGENDKTNHNAALSNVQKGGVYDEVDMILSQIDNEEI